MTQPSDQNPAKVGQGSTYLASLSFEILSRYFHLPIKKAAAELKVGMDSLRRRNKELGITRWPYRKFVKLASLRDNLQKLHGDDTGAIPREYSEHLEREQKRLEEGPHLPLYPRTNRISGRCQRALYKRRLRRRLQEGPSTSTALAANNQNPILVGSSTSNAIPSSEIFDGEKGSSFEDIDPSQVGSSAYDEERERMKLKHVSDFYLLF